MLLGLDVGGTHTDAVIMGGDGIVSAHKERTNHDDLLSSVASAIQSVCRDIDAGSISRVNLSTTLSTNAIVEGSLEETAVFVSSGPGINPEHFRIGRHYFVIEGSIDHRGTVVKELDDAALATALDRCRKTGIRVFSAVTKFSTRNPDQENTISAMAGGMADFVTVGHSLSGQLGFPRRVVTSYYNSAVWRGYNRFADAVDETIRSMGIGAPVNILKADGGTMPLTFSRKTPVESILSGPSASIMGIIALCDITDDSLILDIGGTTTDLAFFASGAPLIEMDGITLGGRATNVRALRTVSFGIGGDSEISVRDGKGFIGPLRKGPSLADGGRSPALIDAMIYTGAASFGSIDQSRAGIVSLASRHGIDPGELARSAVNGALEKIAHEIDAMLSDINNAPVYTIHEMLERKDLSPEKVYVMGGPAAAFKDLLEKRLGLPVIVPDHSGVANAIGAAAARTTLDIELFADTVRGRLIVPNLDIRKELPRDYDLSSAEKDAVMFLRERVGATGADKGDIAIDIVESSSFNVIQGYSGSGKDIRVKCQVRPGVTVRLHDGGAR